MTRLGRCWGLPAGVMAVAVGLVVLSSVAVTHEAVAEPSCNDPGTALPVVIVHGFRSDEGAMSGLVAILENTQVDVAVEPFDYGAYSTSWVTHEQIGPKLRERLLCLADASMASGGLGRVVVVGHSMGGLATRHALSTDPGDGRGQLVEEIALVATIGTPHEGSLWGNVAGPAFHLKRSLNTQMWGHPTPLAGSSAASALAVRSSQLGELPGFPDGVPVRALASEYIGQSRFLFFRSPEVRIGDAVVSRPSALSLYHETNGMGGTDEITCRMTLPLELGMHSINAAITVELLANPAVRDCGHTWQYDAHRLVGVINTDIAVAANQPPRVSAAFTVSNTNVGDLSFGASADDAISFVSGQIGDPSQDTGWVQYFELRGEAREHGVEGFYYRTPDDYFDWYWPWPWYRETCWQHFCLQLGGTTVEDSSLRGWTLDAFLGEWVYDETVPHPLLPLIELDRSGISLGSSWEDVQRAYPQATLGIGEGGGLHINSVWGDWQWRLSARHDFASETPSAPPGAQVTFLAGGTQRGFPCC